MLSVSYDLKRHLENLAASRPADQSPRGFRFMPIYGKSCESVWWEKPGGRVYFTHQGYLADRYIMYDKCETAIGVDKREGKSNNAISFKRFQEFLCISHGNYS